jgi:signal transduction histidine kinase
MAAQLLLISTAFYSLSPLVSTRLAVVVVVALYLLIWLVRLFRRHQALSRARLHSRIAANLHDELGGLLMRLHLQTETLLQQRQNDAELHQLLTTTQAASTALRDVAWGLDATADTAHALQDRMHDYLDQLALSTPLAITFTTEGLDDVATLPNQLRQEIYLVFKEAITNVLRHARQATNLAVRLHRQRSSLILEVLDNGVPVAPRSRQGMGMRNMASRAKAVGGTLKVGPRSDGPGFRVWLCSPLPTSATGLLGWLR